jgi:hypothetical protein
MFCLGDVYFLLAYHCTYNKSGSKSINVALMRVRVTIAAVVKNNYYILSVGVCNVSYPARKTYQPNCIFICSLPGATLFFHTTIQGTIFGKSVLNIKVCCDFLYNFV